MAYPEKAQIKTNSLFKSEKIPPKVFEDSLKPLRNCSRPVCKRIATVQDSKGQWWCSRDAQGKTLR